MSRCARACVGKGRYVLATCNGGEYDGYPSGFGLRAYDGTVDWGNTGFKSATECDLRARAATHRPLSAVKSSAWQLRISAAGGSGRKCFRKESTSTSRLVPRVACAPIRARSRCFSSDRCPDFRLAFLNEFAGKASDVHHSIPP